jgi:4-alpha-glucanotransferase
MATSFRLTERASGLLLHPTSLPGPHGCGDLGREACRFVDFLAAAGQRWWQMLPIGPTAEDGAPYSGYSAFAGNPLLISLEALAEADLLTRAELRFDDDARPRTAAQRGPHAIDRVDYSRTIAFRSDRLRRAFQRFAAAGGFERADLRRFIAANADWLAPYALFCALRRAHDDRPWTVWRRPRMGPRRGGLCAADLAEEFGFTLFTQFVFAQQWHALRRYARSRGVGLIGDIPIFVAHESCDVWLHPELFDLDHRGQPRTVSGVPPDLFSRTGQLWGHPQYRWTQHRATGFAWWVARFRRMFALFDAVRVDHFLGFVRAWAVPGRARTAEHGRWIRVPGAELFATLRRRLGPLEIIAEDLGLLTPAAAALRDRCGFPGMRILQFAFDAGGEYHQPHNYPRRCVVYTGTHDNETTVGWFERLRREHVRSRRARRKARPDQRLGERGAAESAYERALRYLGTSGREIHWELIRVALASPADTAIIPVQDLLGLGNEARMNLPATRRGNWQWRLLPGQLTPGVARRLRDLTETYGRLPSERG